MQPDREMIAAAVDKALMDAIRLLFIVSRLMSVLILRDEHIGVHIACQLLLLTACARPSGIYV